MILLIISNLIFLLVGVYVGSKIVTVSLEEDIKKGIFKIKQIIPKSDLTPGVIRRPTPQAVNEKNRPLEEKQANQAMVETLKEIPELNEGR